MTKHKPVVRLTGDTKPKSGRFTKARELLKGKFLVPDDLGGTRIREERTDIISFDEFRGFEEGSLPGGFGPGDRPLSDLPNSEKMTRTERSIMNFLSGQADTPVGRALAGMGEGFLGKVFTVLDAPAEFIERTAGLGAQALAAVGTEERWDEFTHNLRNAWDAGTFAADFTNLPIRENGQITFNEDLPGIDGVIRARKRLTELTNAGVSHEDALEQVRGEVYEDAGGLALRMQLHDAFFHIVGDPINLFLPRLRIIDRSKLALLKRANKRAIPELVETALKSIDEAVDVGKMSDEVADGARAFIKDVPEMTPMDERWLKLTGALDLNGRPGEILSSGELTGLAKTLRSRWNPFGLTPASRASDLAVKLSDNVVAMLANVDNADEAVRMVMAAADGTFDPRIAHMVITHEGAMVRGLLQGFSAKAQQLGNGFELTRPNRQIFDFLKNSMGDDGADLLERLLKSNEMQPIFARAMESVGDNQDEFARLLTAAGIDPATFNAEKMLEIFEPLAKKGMLSFESFIGRLTNEIADFSAQAAAAKFGVSSRGFIAKMADLMKAGESLAFLRINPGYLVRNLVNGEMTGLGRMGIFYRFVPGGMQKFLDRVGIAPTRLRAGFGIAGDVPAHYKKVAGGQQAIKAIDDVIRGIEAGDSSVVTNFAESIRGAKLPLPNFAAMSAKTESGQSFALTTRGIFEYMAGPHDVPEMSKALRGLLGDERASRLTRALRGAWADSEIDDVFLKPATAGMNSRSVVDDASAAFGEDIMRTIPSMEAHAMADDVIEAYSRGGAEAVKDTVERLRGETTQRYSAALKEATSDIQRNIIDHVQHGGIDSALHHHSGMLDEFWGGVHGKYVDEFGAVFEQIKTADPQVAGALWDTVRTRTRTFWDESWDLFEAQSEGITKGLRAWGKDAGQPFPNLKDYGSTFKTWRGGWEKFWKTRDTLIDEWVEARKAGKAIDYSTIKGQIDEAFDAAVAVEDNAFNQLDELMTQYAPKDFQDLYRAGRQEISGVRQLMREHVQRFQADPLGDGRAYLDLDANEQIQAYQHFWRERKTYLDQIVQSEKKSRASMFGDLEARASYGAGTPPPPTLVDEFLAQYDEFAAANAGRVKGPDTLPAPEPGKARSIIQRFREGDPEAVIREFGDVDLSEVGQLTADRLGIDIDEFKSAFFDELLAPPTPEFSANAMSDAEGIIGRIMPQDQGLFELWNMKGSKALDAIGESVIQRGKRPPIKLDDIDEAGEKLIRSYIEQSKANLASSRYQAIKFGEWKRDSGLLNYNRRLNYNTWLGTIMPFEFWTTTSIRKWALFTLDRPTMTSLYLRLNDFLLKGYRPESGLPERLRGQIRVNMPMLPDFLGDEVFVDPLALLLPFKQWEYAADSLTQDENRDVGRARRVLQELLNSDEITEQQYALALQNESGPQWERAISLARLDDTEGRTSAFDFMSLLTAPHVPIAWAQQILKGTPEDIRPLLPLTRTIKGVTALLGVGEAGGINIEGNIREFLGLPRFDKWDDYRTNRMLANMVADGIITAQQANLAMVSESGEHYEEAKRRAGIEFGVGAVGSTFGIPLKAYPPGEEHLRKLKDDYEAAWDQYNAGDDTALNDFFEENPDYESRRLALEFDPQEQLRRFLIDEIWDRWNDFPIQHKRDVADGLGEVFQTAFLDKETRSTDNITSDMLQAWLQIMGGETPGQAEWDQDLHPIELTDPATAQRLDAFYLTRRQNFRYNENVAPLWDTYFKLDKEARKKFFRENPILKQYLDWRNDFMFRNPDLAPFIEDDPDKLPVFETLEELQEAEQAQPDFTWFEWQNVLTLPMWRLARDMLRYGDNLGEDEVEELIDVADGLGIEFEELMFRLEGAYEEAEGAPVEAAPSLPLEQLGLTREPAQQVGQRTAAQAIAEGLVPERRLRPFNFAQRQARTGKLFGDDVVAAAVADIQRIDEVTNETLGLVVDAGIARGMQEDESVDLFIRTLFPERAGTKEDFISGLREQTRRAIEGYTGELMKIVTELQAPAGGTDFQGAAGFSYYAPTQHGDKFRRQRPPGYYRVNPEFEVFITPSPTAFHEAGHIADSAVGGKGLVSSRPAFRRAVEKVVQLDIFALDEAEEPYADLVFMIQRFPGVGGNSLAETRLGEWGGHGELFAAIMEASIGQMERIPPALRSFYQPWVKR